MTLLHQKGTNCNRHHFIGRYLLVAGGTPFDLLATGRRSTRDGRTDARGKRIHQMGVAMTSELGADVTSEFTDAEKHKGAAWSIA